jgi:hypothetical protein
LASAADRTRGARGPRWGFDELPKKVVRIDGPGRHPIHDDIAPISAAIS